VPKIEKKTTLAAVDPAITAKPWSSLAKARAAGTLISLCLVTHHSRRQAEVVSRRR